MRNLPSRKRFGWAAFAAMAFIALATLVLVPPGYMLGGGERTGPAHIVICTGHGPVETAIDLGKTVPAKRGNAARACAFVGHGSAAPISVPPAIGVAWPHSLALGVRQASQVSIGRGLAAPPLARAPPVFL